MLTIEELAEYGDYVLLRVDGSEPLGDPFRGVRAALVPGVGIVGGSALHGDERRFGSMLAPLPTSPFGFELVLIAAKVNEAGADALVRGPIDVPALAAALIARDLIDEPLPDDPLLALVELAYRARTLGREVVCLPSFAWTAGADADDRGRPAALRAFAARHPDLRAVFRRPPGIRARFIDRDVRVAGGRHVREARRRPPLTILVHGDDARAAARRAGGRAIEATGAALAAAMRVRGDRYLLVAHARHLPDTVALDTLVERIEDDANVVLAAPDASALDGTCVLLHAGRFPQHVVPVGETLGDALASLVDAARTLRRGVRVPALPSVPSVVSAAPPPAAMTAVFLAGSAPEVTRVTLDALLAQIVAGDVVVAAVASGAETTQRALQAFPQLTTVIDPGDPLLSDATNRALGDATTALVAVVADDVLLGRGALAALRAAFAAIPTLGAAIPAVAGAPGQEAAHLDYPDLAAFEKLAERRAKERAREREPIDDAGTPVLVVAGPALQAVGGIDPVFGPTRRGIADLVLRLRAAGYAVVRCDDAVAHRFTPEQSHNAGAHADRAGNAGIPLGEVAAAIAAGFDPARAIPFRRDVAAPHPDRADVAIAVPVASASDLEHATAIVAAAARAYDVRDPLRLHVLLDGEVDVASAAARLRPVLAESGRPMETTVNVRVERQRDLAAWRAALRAETRVIAVHELRREALRDVPHIALHGIARVLKGDAS